MVDETQYVRLMEALPDQWGYEGGNILFAKQGLSRGGMGLFLSRPCFYNRCSPSSTNIAERRINI